ncbi:hypothetical protein ACNKHT_25820 [Shigella flexneri]
MLEPTAELRKLEAAGPVHCASGTAGRAEIMPWQAVWEMSCQRHDTQRVANRWRACGLIEKADFKPAWVNAAGCGASPLSGLQVAQRRLYLAPD